MSMIEGIFHHYFPSLGLKHGLVLFMLIFTRWTALSIMIPFFGANILPWIVRLGICGSLSILSFIMISHNKIDLGVINTAALCWLFVKEVMIGFLLGFFSSFIFYVYQIFGEFTDYFRGAGMSKLLVPEMKHFASPLGVLAFQLALVLLIGLGLHREIIAALFLSFHHFPPLEMAPALFNKSLFSDSLSILDMVWSMSLKLSLPVVAVCLLLDVGFGLLNRIAPTINAYFLSLPAKMIGGLLILFFAIPFLLEEFLSQYQSATQIFIKLIPTF